MQLCPAIIATTNFLRCYRASVHAQHTGRTIEPAAANRYMAQRTKLGLTSTWKIPRLALVEVDVDHGDATVRGAAATAAFAGELAAEVVQHELVVPGVEPEPRRQPRLHHADQAHGGFPSP